MTDSTPVVLITGSARRIGAAMSRHLHAAGYNVVVHYRQAAADAAALVAMLNAARQGSALAVQADLADEDAPQQLIDAALARFGHLDALINNASSFYPTAVGTTTQAQWNDLLTSNARAPYFLSQAAVESLRSRRGCILNLIDLYAKTPLRNHPVYCMAKAALSMMTLALARDLGPDIRVNAIAPGAILWPDAGLSGEAQAAMIAATPLQRADTVDDIARAALFLLRDAPFVTGQILHVDGGRSI